MPPPTRYRHRETGTVARVVGYEQTLDGRRVTLDCLDNPTRHYELGFPFIVTMSHIDAGPGPFARPIPGRLYTEPLTVDADTLLAEWEPMPDA